MLVNPIVSNNNVDEIINPSNNLDKEENFALDFKEAKARKLKADIVFKIWNSPGNYRIEIVGNEKVAVPLEDQEIPNRYLRKFVEYFIAPNLEYNTLAMKIEYKGQVVKFDDLKAYMEEMLEATSGYSYTFKNEKTLESYVKYFAFKNKYSPVKRYLENVSNTVAPIDITNLATRYFGLQGEYATFCDKLMFKFLIGAVARTYQPGCKLDSILFLIGEQGCRKSTFFNVLSKGWFDDTVKNLTDKDELLKINQAWIIELAEAERVVKVDSAVYKAQVSTPVDVFRKPYGKDNDSFPRPSIIVGTSNHRHILLDHTGNRRSHIIEIPKEIGKIDTDLLSTEIDSIWASAVLEYTRGTNWWLTEEEDDENKLNNQKHMISNTAHQLIDDFFFNNPQIECASFNEIGRIVFDNKHLTTRNIKMDMDTYLVKLQKLERTRKGAKQIEALCIPNYTVRSQCDRYLSPYFNSPTALQAKLNTSSTVDDALQYLN